MSDQGTTTVLRCAQLEATPWKNGGGSTRELAAAPVGATMANFDWRVSIAEVKADGPFSAFPGVDRVIMLLEGAEMILDIDGVTHRLGRFEPLAFSGEADTQCQIPSGATRDLNLMTRRGRVDATMRTLDVDDAGAGVAAAGVAVGADETVLLVVLSDGLRLEDESRGSMPLGALDSVLRDTPGQVHLAGSGLVAEIRIRARA